MEITIACSEIERQVRQQLDLPEATTVMKVIQRSGLLERFRGIDFRSQKVGLFGKLTKLDGAVTARDRVEIYRPVTADPKTTSWRKRDGDGSTD